MDPMAEDRDRQRHHGPVPADRRDAAVVGGRRGRRDRHDAVRGPPPGPAQPGRSTSPSPPCRWASPAPPTSRRWSLFRQVVQRDIDYEDLSRGRPAGPRHPRATRSTCTDARADDARGSVSSGHHRPRWAVTGGYGVMCAGVALHARRERGRGGGGRCWRPSASTGCSCGWAVGGCRTSTSRSPARPSPRCSRWVAASLGIGIDPSQAITANIIMLLSGIGFMGALQDACPATTSPAARG